MRYLPRALAAIRKRARDSGELLAPPPRQPVHYTSGLPMAVIPLLLAVAIVGYLVGHSRSKSEPAASSATVRSAHVLLEFPVGWRTVLSNPPIPHLSFARALVLAPRGRAATAGLIVGELPAGQRSPLPDQFVSVLPRLPAVDVVQLAEIQAFRYTRLSVPGFKDALTIFVIPNPGGSATTLACYASSARSSYMRACEQAVSAVTVLGQPQTYQLAPESGYAGKISTVISSLDRRRAALTRDLRPPVSATRAQQLAMGLSAGFALAAASLSRLEPSPVAAQAQAALSTSIERVRGDYQALADAAAERDVSAYMAAQKRVSEAESGVDDALETLVLLGYSPALSGLPSARS